MCGFLLSVFLLIGSSHAFIPEGDSDTCVNLILCTLRSPINVYEFVHYENFVVEVDKNGCNIAEEQRNRSAVTELGDYECVTIKNLQATDAGVYYLFIAKDDGKRYLRMRFPLTKDVINNLRNESYFNSNGSNSFQGLLIPVYWSTSKTELPEALRRILSNGTNPDDFILALQVISQNPATTPPGTALPPKGRHGVLAITILVIVFVVIAIAIIAFVLWEKKRCSRTLLCLRFPKLEQML